MSNIMTSFYVGVSGLSVNQNALNTTSHNLTNVSTKGFVRQQIVIKDFGYVNIGQAANYKNQVGLGTATEIVRQVRNKFLDERYRNEVGRLGYYEAQQKTVNEIEDVFGELEGVSFQKQINELKEAMQEISKTPDDIVARASFVKKAEAFIERAQKISQQVNDYQVNLNLQLKDKVNRVNEIGDKIQKLNQQIQKYESSGVERANDLRDTRNAYLDELGQIVDISYSESENGVVTVSVEGFAFVNDTSVNHMELQKVNPSSDMLKPVWKTTGSDVFNLDRVPTPADNTDIGSLKGILISRGDDVANYTDVPIQQKGETDAAYNKRVDKYNKEVQSSVIRTVQAQFDQMIHGIVTAINDILAPNIEVETLGGQKIKVLDEANAPTGSDPDHTIGEALFNRKGMDRYQETTMTVFLLDASGNKIPDGAGGFVTQTKKFYVYNEENPTNNYSLYTLGELEINPKILSNYSVLPLSSTKNPDAFDNETVMKLIDMWNKPFATLGPNNSTTFTYGGYYDGFWGELSNRGNTLLAISSNQEITVNEIDNSRQNFMGVNTDEELTNLIRFQHSYNASARYINVIDEMLEHLITRL